VDLEVDKLGNEVARMKTMVVEMEETHTGGKGVYNQWIHCDFFVIF